MTDISAHMSEAQRHMRVIDDTIAHATMTRQQWETTRKAVILARAAMDDALQWLRDNPIER